MDGREVNFLALRVFKDVVAGAEWRFSKRW
jgi:hypothetical protein